MSNWKLITPILISIGILTILMICIFPLEQNIVTQKNLKKITELEYHNKMLIEVNEILDDKIFVLEAQTDSLTNLILQNRKEVIQLKTKRHEKVRAMDNYNDDQLYRYFTKFRTKSDSTKR